MKGIFRYIYYKIAGGRNSKSINIAAVQVFFTWFLSSSEMWLRQVNGRKASVAGNTQALIIRRRPRFVVMNMRYFRACTSAKYLSKVIKRVLAT